MALCRTLFDFMRRAMPWTAPKWLSDDKAYAVTAYILWRNGIIGDSDVIDAKTLPQVEMPNRMGSFRCTRQALRAQNTPGMSRDVRAQ